MRLIILGFPGVKEGDCFGTPAFYVNKKLIARLKEDGETLVVHTHQKETWIETNPEVFFITDHYHNYPSILVHLNKIRKKDLNKILLAAWIDRASKKLIKQWEEKGK